MNTVVKDNDYYCNPMLEYIPGLVNSYDAIP